MPVPPKPADKRQRRNAPQAPANLALVPDDDSVPAPESKWLKSTKDAWIEFWDAPVAKTIDRRAHMQAVTRLFRLYDRDERLERALAKTDWVVEGSKGQPTLNPLLAHQLATRAEIRQMEDRLAGTPMAQFRLGVQFADAATSLADLNRGLMDDDDDAPFDSIDIVEVREA